VASVHDLASLSMDQVIDLSAGSGQNRRPNLGQQRVSRLTGRMHLSASRVRSRSRAHVWLWTRSAVEPAGFTGDAAHSECDPRGLPA